MRRRISLLLILATVCVASTVGAPARSPATNAAAIATSEVPPSPVEAIPLGSYSKDVFTIELDDGRWTLYVTSDAGILEIGDTGTYTYDDDGRLVIVSESSGCPDCVTVIAWSLADDVLTLSIPADQNREIPDDERFVVEGDWTQQAPSTTANAADTAVASVATTDVAPGEATITLRFANPADSAPPQLVTFVEEVERLSEGTIQFEWLPSYGVDAAESASTNPELTIVADLGTSTVDIGWVGARALPGFEALLAPLLVDSQDLQEQVFDAGIPARMLGDLDAEGLVGITVLPGPLRRLAGTEHPFTTPAEFSGQTVAGDYTELTRATMGALGATEIPGRSGFPLDDADAVLAHFGAIVGNGYHTEADSVVANLNLWPRPLTIVMSAESFAALSTEQQGVLIEAGAVAAELAIDAARAEDADGGEQVCAGTIAVIEASEADLAEFEAALQPVYDELAQDAGTAAYLDEIEAIKDNLALPPDTLVCLEE